MYSPRKGVQVPAAFLEEVTPNALHFFPDKQVATVLGYALIWAAFSNELTTHDGVINLLPEEFAAKIRDKWVSAGGQNENPIEKKLLIVSGIGDQLFINSVQSPPSRGPNPPGNPPPGQGNVVDVDDEEVSRPQADGLTTEHLYSQQFFLQQRFEDMAQKVEVRFSEMKQSHARLMTAVRRIALQPVVRPRSQLPAPVLPGNQPRSNQAQGQGIPTQEEEPVLTSARARVIPIPKLMKNPKNLFTLWKEYEHGVNGQKPAKDFTSTERGADSATYSRRNIFWQAVEQLIKRDNTSDTAIDAIYSHYGVDDPVNRILLKMRADRKNKSQPFFHHLR